jgi:hypothetical protein
MPMQKLTPGEISKVVVKIRERYDLYIYKYFKTRRLKLAFEDRYLEALNVGVDVSSFLLAEISAIEELIRREEDKVANGIIYRSEPQQGKKQNFADRILEEQRQMILKYEEVDFHLDASEEVRHLLGGMSVLERKYWPSLAFILRDTKYSRNSMIMMNLESQLRYLGYIESSRASAGLARYIYHLNSFPRDYRAIDREEQEYILQSAFLLNDLHEVLERLDSNLDLDDDKKCLQEITDYVKGLVDDFRLKDLKKQK